MLRMKTPKGAMPMQILGWESGSSTPVGRAVCATSRIGSSGSQKNAMTQKLADAQGAGRAGGGGWGVSAMIIHIPKQQRTRRPCSMRQGGWDSGSQRGCHEAGAHEGGGRVP